MESEVKSTVDISIWFEHFIESLKEDFNQVKLGIAEKNKTEFFEAAMNNDMTKLARLSRETSSMHFIKMLMKSYISELISNKCKVSTLAFDLDNSEILVWAVINDNDDLVENILWMTEAKINAQYYDYGFNLSTTIVEKSDNIEVPSHYKIIN